MNVRDSSALGAAGGCVAPVIGGGSWGSETCGPVQLWLRETGLFDASVHFVMVSMASAVWCSLALASAHMAMEDSPGGRTCPWSRRAVAGIASSNKQVLSSVTAVLAKDNCGCNYECM